MVSNLVKNWEKEASYKLMTSEWRTIDPIKYRFSCNGGPEVCPVLFLVMLHLHVHTVAKLFLQSWKAGLSYTRSLYYQVLPAEVKAGLPARKMLKLWRDGRPCAADGSICAAGPALQGLTPDAWLLGSCILAFHQSLPSSASLARRCRTPYEARARCDSCVAVRSTP